MSSICAPDRAPVPQVHGLPLSAVIAGIVPPFIGFAGTVVVVVRAEQAIGATPLEVSSAIAATGIAVGLTGIVLSCRWRMPLILAWSTPGAALLAGNTAHLTYPLALGAFAVAAMLMMLVALLPPLTLAAERVPAGLASGLLAGILLPFVLKMFGAVPSDPMFAVASLATFLAVRAWIPRHSLSASLLVGVAIILMRGDAGAVPSVASIVSLTPVRPLFAWQALINVAVPLFLVTLVSQNLPGLVVMHAAGYRPSPKWSFFATGAATLVTAPFGGFGVNLAAIVAALCTGPDGHPDPDRRWIVGIFYGATWLTLGLTSGLMVAFLTHLPADIVTVITGIALLGPLVGALRTVSELPDEADASVVTLVTAASGVTFLGIGSAFWALVIGFSVIGMRRLVGDARPSPGASGSRPNPSSTQEDLHR